MEDNTPDTPDAAVRRAVPKRFDVPKPEVKPAHPALGVWVLGIITGVVVFLCWQTARIVTWLTGG